MSHTTVTTLLREFPKIRRAAMAGERIIIRTRQGNLVLTAEKPTGSGILGCLKDRGRDLGLEPGTRAVAANAWRARM